MKGDGKLAALAVLIGLLQVAGCGLLLWAVHTHVEAGDYGWASVAALLFLAVALDGRRSP